MREADRPSARAMLAGLGVHPESQLTDLADFMRLRAARSLKDAVGFTKDQAGLLAWGAIGRKVETFRFGSSEVAALQGSARPGSVPARAKVHRHRGRSFHLPNSTLLPDDRDRIGSQQAIAKPGVCLVHRPQHGCFRGLAIAATDKLIASERP